MLSLIKINGIRVFLIAIPSLAFSPFEMLMDRNRHRPRDDILIRRSETNMKSIDIATGLNRK